MKSLVKLRQIFKSFETRRQFTIVHKYAYNVGLKNREACRYACLSVLTQFFSLKISIKGCVKIQTQILPNAILQTSKWMLNMTKFSNRLCQLESKGIQKIIVLLWSKKHYLHYGNCAKWSVLEQNCLLTVYSCCVVSPLSTFMGIERNIFVIVAFKAFEIFGIWKDFDIFKICLKFHKL